MKTSIPTGLHGEDDEARCQDPRGVVPFPRGGTFHLPPRGRVVPGQVEELALLGEVAAARGHPAGVITRRHLGETDGHELAYW